MKGAIVALLVSIGMVMMTVSVEGLDNIRLNHQRVPGAEYLPVGHLRSELAKATTNETSNLPALGNILPLGIYWTYVGLGTPLQQFQLAIDTGSTDLLLPKVGCDGCHPQVTGEFDPSNSTTSNELKCHNGEVICTRCSDGQCAFSNTYETCNLTAPQQPCTASGHLWTDVATLGSGSANMIFGLIEEQTKNFQQFFYIDGVIGFSFRGSSSFGYTSTFEQLVLAGEYANVFAMCLTPDEGGVLTLGGYDPTLYSGSIPWSPIVSKNAFVQRLQSISVDGQSTSASAGNIIIDSGTNVLLQPQGNFNAIKAAMQAPCPKFDAPGVCDGGLFEGKCYHYSQSQISSFPSISLHLDGATLTVGPGQYILPQNGTANGNYCFGIRNTGLFGLSIIGDVIMQNYYAIFDLANNRIGWPVVQKQNCVSSNYPPTLHL